LEMLNWINTIYTLIIITNGSHTASGIYNNPAQSSCRTGSILAISSEEDESL